MEDFLAHVWDAIVSRLHGPLKFRFILQPLLAAIFAVRAGRADARNGRPPFLWSVFTNPVGRTELLKDGWKDIAKIFVMASVMDLVYQFIVHSTDSIRCERCWSPPCCASSRIS